MASGFAPEAISVSGVEPEVDTCCFGVAIDVWIRLKMVSVPISISPQHSTQLCMHFGTNYQHRMHNGTSYELFCAVTSTFLHATAEMNNFCMQTRPVQNTELHAILAKRVERDLMKS